VPTAAEVEPWIETVERLWDDQQEYDRASRAAEARGSHWFQERMAPRYREFFGSIFPQPGPPFLPRPLPSGDRLSTTGSQSPGRADERRFMANR
jgi:hypothetical protein